MFLDAQAVPALPRFESTHAHTFAGQPVPSRTTCCSLGLRRQCSAEAAPCLQGSSAIQSKGVSEYISSSKPGTSPLCRNFWLSVATHSSLHSSESDLLCLQKLLVFFNRLGPLLLSRNQPQLLTRKCPAQTSNWPPFLPSLAPPVHPAHGHSVLTFEKLLINHN